MKPTKNRYFCHDCQRTKMLFPSEKKADMFIARNSQEMKDDGLRVPVRSYYCDMCGGWHVTSNPKTEVFVDGTIYNRLTAIHDSTIKNIQDRIAQEAVVREERNTIWRKLRDAALNAGNEKLTRQLCLELIVYANEHPEMKTYTEDICFACSVISDIISEKIKQFDDSMERKTIRRRLAKLTECTGWIDEIKRCEGTENMFDEVTEKMDALTDVLQQRLLSLEIEQKIIEHNNQLLSYEKRLTYMLDCLNLIIKKEDITEYDDTESQVIASFNEELVKKKDKYCQVELFRTVVNKLCDLACV